MHASAVPPPHGLTAGPRPFIAAVATHPTWETPQQRCSPRAMLSGPLPVSQMCRSTTGGSSVSARACRSCSVHRAGSRAARSDVRWLQSLAQLGVTLLLKLTAAHQSAWGVETGLDADGRGHRPRQRQSVRGHSQRQHLRHQPQHQPQQQLGVGDLPRPHDAGHLTLTTR